MKLLRTYCLLTLMTSSALAGTPLFNSMAEFFSTEDRDSLLKGSTNNHLTLSREALGVEFLLSPSIVQQAPLQSFSALAAKIVTFKQVGDQLFLLQSLEGNVVKEDIPSEIILTKFPVISESDHSITFDFNEGMSQIFVDGSYSASDFALDPANSYTAINLGASYIEEATLVENNRLFIRQRAQMHASQLGSVTIEPLEMRYFLELYKPNKNFAPFRSPIDFYRVGFFESPLKYNSSGTFDVYAIKFDTTKPITFALSSTIPKEYREAVRAGVLYWNKAFGREVVKVKDAPKGVSAPHPDYNIIHWATLDLAAFAYADMQTDPRTGEALNSQILLSSGWVKLIESQALTEIKKPLSLKPRGLENKPLCHYHKHGDSPSALVTTLKDIAHSEEKSHQEKARQIFHTLSTVKKARPELASLRNLAYSPREDDQEKILEMARDSLATVVAHEVGHVLGLRHNFAGNIIEGRSLADRDKQWESYMKGNTLNDVTVSTSVMDYISDKDSIMLGHQIRSGKVKALTYDQLAIQVLYEGKALDGRKPEELPLFCTDSHLGVFADCTPYDTSPSPFEDTITTFDNMIDMTPYQLLNQFIMAIDPMPGLKYLAPPTVEQVELVPSFDAIWHLTGRFMLVDLFTPGGRLVSVDRSFIKIDEINKKEVEKTTTKKIMEGIELHGDLEKIFSVLPENFVDKELARFKEVLHESYVQGMGYSFNEYQLSKEQIAHIESEAEKYYRTFNNAVSEISLFAFSLPLPPLRDDKLTSELAQFLLKTAQYYLTATKKGSIIEGTIQVKRFIGDLLGTEKIIPVKINEPLYSFEVRKLAAKILSHNWTQKERTRMHGRYKALLDATIGGKDFDKIKDNKVSQSLRQWHKEQKKILVELEGFSLGSLFPFPF